MPTGRGATVAPASTAATARFVQVEITTVCNFACFYCAGRAMPQRHMTAALFEQLLAQLPRGRPDITVSLQGEGEPTLHPQFWALVEAVRTRGLTPYTITNASRVDAARFDRLMPLVGMSLDTVDEAEAQRIGRFNLPKVLAGLDALLARLGPRRVLVHSVDYGQPLEALQAYVAGLGGVRHLIQPLQRKPDYLRHYPAEVWQPMSAGVTLPRPPGPARVLHCAYLAGPRMRYFNIDGIELPCCFIKDVPAGFSADALRVQLAAGRIPGSCRDCRELR